MIPTVNYPATQARNLAWNHGLTWREATSLPRGIHGEAQGDLSGEPYSGPRVDPVDSFWTASWVYGPSHHKIGGYPMLGTGLSA